MSGGALESSTLFCGLLLINVTPALRTHRALCLPTSHTPVADLLFVLARRLSRYQPLGQMATVGHLTTLGGATRLRRPWNLDMNARALLRVRLETNAPS